MTAETRQCQNCKQNFAIAPDDFSFYEKIRVPPPTFCPGCRMQRRLAYRNTHAFYKRKDSFSGKEMISMYSPDKNLTVIDRKAWWGDSWDPINYGINYDFTKSFFSQWKEFRDKFPLQNLQQTKSVNSEYCNVAEESKDCYLISASWKNERVLYSDSITEIKDSADLHVVRRSQFSYEDTVCADSYQLFYSEDSHNCVNSYFLFDCRNCTDCFMCSGLRSKSHCFYNQQLNKEEYQKKMSKMDVGSHTLIENLKKDFEGMKLKSIRKFAHIVNSYDVTGDNIVNAKNCHMCFDLMSELQDCKYSFWGVQGKDIFDCGPGFGVVELMYETFDAGPGGKSILLSHSIHTSENVEYSFYCHDCSNIFACFGLRNKSYCIFNKQYSKDEYNELREKIINHMNEMPYKDGKENVYKYGEFFPADLSPFCYNETVAQDHFPIKKEDALKTGLSWKDMETRNYVPTLFSKDIPDNIKDVPDTILSEVIECAHKGACSDRCTTAFRVIPNELTFYRKFNIPIPRLCYGCRHYARLHKRNPMKLWHRQCMCDKSGHDHSDKCPNEFETSYSPKRPEAVYCEQCYQKEVY